MRLFLIILLILTVLPVSWSQRNCGSTALFENLMTTDSMFRSYQKSNARVISSAERTPDGVITIPVVVHIIYNNEDENLSDEQIYSQIDVINKDFRRMNSDADERWAQAVDTEIEFCLARLDPNGNFTTGITRTATDVTKFTNKTDMKFTANGGHDAWPAEDYLNMWVCDIDDLLGFATFPGGDLSIDGVVMDYLSFGKIGELKERFNLGRTTTHEIGHWLNLRHIWGDGDCDADDFVLDTPSSDGPNYGCEVGFVSCGSEDMVENYMDYSDDVCMNLFTSGQKTRMRALFMPGGFRESLLTSPAFQAQDCDEFYVNIRFDDYPADISWELKDNSSQIIASGDSYPVSLAGGYYNVYTGCLEEGDYVFDIMDSYGDGLCCNEGEGSYDVGTSAGEIYESDGNFGIGEILDFSVSTEPLTFVGPGTSYYDPANWNRGFLPSPCYDDVIYIESNCDVDEFSASKYNLVVGTGATLTVLR